MCRRLHRCLSGVTGQILPGVPVDIVQHLEAGHRRHHCLCVGIDDRQIQAVCHCQCEEAGVHLFPAGQPKRNVGNTQYRFNAQTLFHHAYGFQSLPHRFLLGAGRKSKAVDIYVFPRDACGFGRGHDFLRQCKPLLRQRRDTVFIQRQAYDRSSVFFADGKQTVQHRLFPVYRVDDRLAVVYPKPRFQNIRTGGIELQRQIAHALHSLYSTDHHFLFINFRQAHIYVQDIRARARLFHRLGKDIIHISVPKRLFKTLFSRGIDPFAYHTYSVDFHSAYRSAHGTAPHRLPVHRRVLLKSLGEQRQIFGRSTAAPSYRRNSQRLEALQFITKFLRADAVPSGGRVRQARIWFDEHRQAGCGAQPLRHWIDLRRTQ